MIPTNIVTVTFGTLFSRSRSAVAARSLHQWDYGQVLQLFGIDLPELYSVHFSNLPLGGEAIVEVGNADGVPIPDALLETGLPVYAWVYLHTGDSDGETAYSVTIPVIKRSQPTDGGHDPADVDSIDRAITALNGAVEAAETAQRGAETAQQAAEEAAEGAQTAVSGAVRFDGDQDLSEEEREQARANIDAASIIQVDEEVDELEGAIDALVARVAELERQLSAYNTKKFCDSTTPQGGSVNGVGFSWTGNFRCSVYGTALSNAESDYFAYSDDLAADGIETGKSYFLRFKSTGSRVYLRVTYWTLSDGGELVPHSENYNQETTYVLPRTAVAFGLSLYVYTSSAYVSENVDVGLYSAAPSNKDLYYMIKALQSSSTPGDTPIIVGP